MPGSSGIPAVDRLGDDLAAALRRPAKRSRGRRLRIVFAAAFVAGVLAVPAVATRVDWAHLVGGATPLPAQAPPEQRLPLAGGVAHGVRWSIVGYRARLAERGGNVGTCVFLTTTDGGSGRCAAPDQLLPMTLVSDGVYPSGAAAGLVGRGIDTVELHYGAGVTRRVNPRPLDERVARRLRLPPGTSVFIAPVRQRAPFAPRSAVGLRGQQVVAHYPTRR